MGYELEMQGVTFAYPHQKPLFRDADLQVAAGQIVVLLGPNGIGKSTLLGCLSGRLRPQAGRVCVGGRDLATLSARQRAAALAVVAQSGKPSALSVSEYLLLGRVAHHGVFGQPDGEDHALVSQALTQVGLDAYADVSLQTLSGGQRQLVMIAAALVQAAQVVILDEPTAALDLKNQVLVLRLLRRLKQLGKAIVVTTHDPNQATLIADSVAIVAHQRLEQLEAAALTVERLTALYQTPIGATRHGSRQIFIIEGVD